MLKSERDNDNIYELSWACFETADIVRDRQEIFIKLLLRPSKWNL